MSEKKDERTLDSKELAALKDRLKQARDGLGPPAYAELPGQENDEPAVPAETELPGQENDEPAAPAEAEQPGQENDEPAVPAYTELPEQVRCDIATAARYCSTDVPKEKEVYDLAAALAAESAWQYFRGEAGKYTGAYKTVMEDLYRDINLLFNETLPAYDPGFTVTDHMLNTLRKRLTQARSGLALPYNIKLSGKTNHDIVLTVHCCNRLIPEEKEVLDLAVTLAGDAAWFVYRKEAAKYRDDQNTDMNDLYQEFLMWVGVHILDYRPEYDINTYLKKRVKSVFYNTKAKGRGQSTTKHYQDSGVKVKHAMSELEKIGNKNISAEDIYEYIAATEKNPVPLATIERCLMQDATCLSLSVVGENALNREYQKGPEETFMDKVKNDYIHETIERLSPNLREVLHAYLDFVTEYSKTPTSEELKVVLNKDGAHSYTERRVSSLLTAALDQFSRHYKSEKRRLDSPVNRVRFRKVSYAQEDEDIMGAIADDPTLLDEDEE